MTSSSSSSSSIDSIFYMTQMATLANDTPEKIQICINTVLDKIFSKIPSSPTVELVKTRIRQAKCKSLYEKNKAIGETISKIDSSPKSIKLINDFSLIQKKVFEEIKFLEKKERHFLDKVEMKSVSTTNGPSSCSAPEISSLVKKRKPETSLSLSKRKKNSKPVLAKVLSLAPTIAQAISNQDLASSAPAIPALATSSPEKISKPMLRLSDESQESFNWFLPGEDVNDYLPTETTQDEGLKNIWDMTDEELGIK